MIYSTNRTASIGEVQIDVDVNESYFGEGSFYFMQEAAQDELALFENAIKTDIDEVLIGESADELKALNEGFVAKTALKIQELMRKFIEWLKGVTRSALAKMNQYIVRDNATFCKNARKMIEQMGDRHVKAKGTVIKDFNVSFDSVKSLAVKIKDASGSSMDELESAISGLEKEIDSKFEEMDKAAFAENVEYDLAVVKKHISFLEDNAKADLKKLKKTMDEFEKEAKNAATEAKKLERAEEDEAKKKDLAMKAKAAAAFKVNGQKICKKFMTLLKKMIKVARAVVTRVAGARNEGVEYTPELIEALIETDNYELDEMLEEMCEAKKSDCDDDDIEDEE